MRFFLSLLGAFLLLFSSSTSANPFEHELRQVREDIHVAVRPDVNRVPVTGNITLIINENDVVVVDSGRTPAAAENVIALLREKTALPVSAVINTHWHDDHHLGNSVWRHYWPDVEFISHEKTRDSIAGEPMARIENEAEELRNARQTLADRIEKGVDAQGAPMSAAMLERTRRILATIPLLLEQSEITELVVPDRVYTDTLTLERPNRRIEVRYLGRGNTDGDSVVFLPDDGVVITGDLVVMPLPYGFYSYPSDWVQTLERIQALEWRTLVPGHGEPQSDGEYVDALITLLADINTQVAAGHAAGKTLEDIRDGIELANAAYFTNEDPVLERLFHAYWIMPITRSAWKEVTGTPIVQGIEPT